MDQSDRERRLQIRAVIVTIALFSLVLILVEILMRATRLRVDDFMIGRSRAQERALQLRSEQSFRQHDLDKVVGHLT